MRIAIIQMSDLHITSGNDFIVKNVQLLAKSIAAQVNGCDKVVVVVTGDIIDKGKVENYELAKTMFSKFENEIRKDANLITWDYVFVPGNHDLDFSMDVPYRDMAIEKTLKEGAIPRKEFENDILKPQEAFWSFYSGLIDEQIEAHLQTPVSIKIPNLHHFQYKNAEN